MTKPGPIIIFEDDLEEVEFLKEAFRRLGVTNELLFFDDGANVLSYLRTTTKQPFLILSDINVHKMDGLELRGEIQKDEYLRQKSIPFVYLSTSSKKDIVTKAYDLTVQGFFKKQNTIDQIEKQLKLILDYWHQCYHPNTDN